jgi:hypothetical protein
MVPAAADLLGDAALGGQAVLVLAALAVVVCAIALVPRLRRVRRLARLVEVRARLAEVELTQEWLTLQGGRDELVRRLRPWRRLLFWLRHPLTRALVRSYWGR